MQILNTCARWRRRHRRHQENTHDLSHFNDDYEHMNSLEFFSEPTIDVMEGKYQIAMDPAEEKPQ